MIYVCTWSQIAEKMISILRQRGGKRGAIKHIACTVIQNNMKNKTNMWLLEWILIILRKNHKVNSVSNKNFNIWEDRIES